MAKRREGNSRLVVKDGKIVTQHRVTHTVEWYNSMPEYEFELLLAKAEMFIGKQGWTYEEFDREVLLYKTAFFLWAVDPLLMNKRKFPCYVVHDMVGDTRFESGSREVIYRHFKTIAKNGGRAGMFYWADDRTQQRLYACGDYPYGRDYGPREG